MDGRPVGWSGGEVIIMLAQLGWDSELGNFEKVTFQAGFGVHLAPFKQTVIFMMHTTFKDNVGLNVCLCLLNFVKCLSHVSTVHAQITTQCIIAT